MVNEEIEDDSIIIDNDKIYDDYAHITCDAYPSDDGEFLQTLNKLNPTAH